MEDSPEAPGSIDLQTTSQKAPNNRRSIISPYSLQSLTFNLPTNTPSQQASIPAPLSPDTINETPNSTNNAAITVAESSISHNKEHPALVLDSTYNIESSNTLHRKIKESDISPKRNNSLPASEHSSGSDAAFYCSVGGSPSEEDVETTPLFHASETEVGVVPTSPSASAPNSSPGFVAELHNAGVGGENKGEKNSKECTEEIARKRRGNLSRFIKRLFNRKN